MLRLFLVPFTAKGDQTISRPIEELALYAVLADLKIVHEPPLDQLPELAVTDCCNLTAREVKEILDQIRLKRADEEELGYELRRAIRHAELFSKGTAEESLAMVAELMKLEKMNKEIAVKIADIRPVTKDELRAIYAKERFTLSEEELNSILEIVFRG